MRSGTYFLGVIGIAVGGWLLYYSESPQLRPHTENPLPQRKSLNEMPTSRQLVHPVSLPPSKITQIAAELVLLNDCYKKPCGSETVDPRTNFFDTGKKIQEKLLQLRQWVHQQKPLEPVLSNEVARITHESIENVDGHVQEAALDLAAELPPNEQILDAILQNVIEGFDAELIQQALLELQRYTSERAQIKIRNVLGDVLSHGSPFVSEAVAARAHLFLNEGSVEYFEKLISQINPGSKTYTYLQASLREYQKHTAGG